MHSWDSHHIVMQSQRYSGIYSAIWNASAENGPSWDSVEPKQHTHTHTRASVGETEWEKKNAHNWCALPFFHEPFYNSTGKIPVIWMQTEWAQLGLTNACKMMHDGIYEIETHTPFTFPNVFAGNPLEICECHLDFHSHFGYYWCWSLLLPLKACYTKKKMRNTLQKPVLIIKIINAHSTWNAQQKKSC